MADVIEDDVSDSDDSVELVLINPETNLPYDEDDPVIISGTDFRFIKNEAAAKGMTFEQYFTYIIRLAIENSASAKGFTKADFELEKFEDLK